MSLKLAPGHEQQESCEDNQKEDDAEHHGPGLPTSSPLFQEGPFIWSLHHTLLGNFIQSPPPSTSHHWTEA